MNLVRILSTYLLLSFAHIVYANSWYQVELIVFARNSPDLDGERWRDMEFQDTGKLTELQPHTEALATDELVPFMVLPTSRNRLSGVYNVLGRSSKYRPLLHVSWQQPAAERQQSYYVHIQKLKDNQFIPVADDIAVNERLGSTESLARVDKVIDGSIRIRSGYYLHVDLDLFYFTGLRSEDKLMRGGDALQHNGLERSVIQLKETRKIKLNEIHYFDHPMFGVIAQVSRL